VGFSAALLLLLTAAPAAPSPPDLAPPDLAQFEAALAAQDSATAALRQWCEVRHLAANPAMRAVTVVGKSATPPADLRRQLAIPGDTAFAYRHVRLSCGGKVLSEAHNWYVPERLTAAMNTALAETDTPFGRIAAPLGFRRERIAGERGQTDFCPTGTILAHKALLRLPDGRPLSLVIECYTAANLAAPVN
jgi:hypothetical protein